MWTGQTCYPQSMVKSVTALLFYSILFIIIIISHHQISSNNTADNYL